MLFSRFCNPDGPATGSKISGVGNRGSGVPVEEEVILLGGEGVEAPLSLDGRGDGTYSSPEDGIEYSLDDSEGGEAAGRDDDEEEVEEFQNEELSCRE